MVWVLCEIALRPDYQKELYTEVQDIFTDGPENLTHDDLQGAVRLDSFIREVMRTKGDTFSTVRMTMHDTVFDGYLIPKGQSTFLQIQRLQVLINIWDRLHCSSQCISCTQRPRSSSGRGPRGLRWKTVVG